MLGSKIDAGCKHRQVLALVEAKSKGKTAPLC